MILDKKYYDAYGPFKGSLSWLKNLLVSVVSHLLRTQRYLKEDTLATLGWPVLKAENKPSYDACLMSAKICPTQALVVEGQPGQKVQKFFLKIERCTQCALCVNAVKESVLEMSDRHQLALHAEQPRELSLLS